MRTKLTLLVLLFSLPVVAQESMRSAAVQAFVKVDAAAVALTNVTLIDGVSEQARPATTVIVSGDRIVALGPSVEVEVPADAQLIDGTGRFLIPGLFDAHAHLSYWGEDAIGRLVAAGVTSIRELGGDLDEIDLWKRAVEAGELVGPAMYWCGPFFEGPEGGDEYRIKVSNAAQVHQGAAALQYKGVDFFKIQPRIGHAEVEALIDEARAMGLYVVGHLPEGMSLLRASALGLRSIEHMSPYMDLDSESLDAVIAAFLENGTAVSPALFSMVAPIQARGEDPAANARMQRANQIVARFHRAGVRILAGSNFAYRTWPQRPGTSMHGEMAALVAAGLSEMEVLRLSTSGAAAFLGVDDRSGSVRPGLSADLVLLNADPLADIANVARIEAVVLRGRLLERPYLDSLAQ